jgi:hypothetical protein
VLRLRYVRPGGLMSFVLFEGVIGTATLLALAELVTWWAVAALPAAVAAMVKLNDLVSGAMSRGGHALPASRDDLAAADTQAFGLPDVAAAGEPAAIPGARSSRVYVSGARAAGAANRAGAAPADAARTPRVERRLEEAARRAGLDRRATAGTRPGGRTGGNRESQKGAAAREPRNADAGVSREVVGRPEWHQTVTIGRHARSDANRVEQARDAGADYEADAPRHRASPANQGRFA